MYIATCKKLNVESTRVPQEILVTHSLSTRSGFQSPKTYGCIVFSGDGDGDTTGEIIGDGVIWGCAATAALDGMGDGDMDSIGDADG